MKRSYLFIREEGVPCVSLYPAPSTNSISPFKLLSIIYVYVSMIYLTAGCDLLRTPRFIFEE